MASDESLCGGAALWDELVNSKGNREDGDNGGEFPRCTTPVDAELVPQVAELVADMAITQPEVLRVTLAYQALQNCAEAFRSTHKDLYHQSRQSQQISSFWSHSWHGSASAKVMTLLVLYNGLASVVLGTLGAFVIMCLYSFQLLPGIDRGIPGVLWSFWSMASGLMISVAFFLLWKPQQEVFFDRICISGDSDLKAQAIFSLAGMLKNSKEMLVLWDPSWSDRLWCLFELAAFLKCRAEGTGKVLIVRPTFVGPCSITAFLAVFAAMLGFITTPIAEVPIPLISLVALGTLVGFSTVITFRAYFRSVQILEEALQATSFDSVKSSCCEVNHVDSEGCEMLCDREILKQCVIIWFGNMKAFEGCIRSELSELLTEELRQNVFTQRWVLKVATPVLWAYMDLAATNISLGLWEFALESFVQGMTVWLLCGPIFGEAFILLTSFYSSATSGIFKEFLLNLALILALALVAGSICGIYFAGWYVFSSRTRLFRAAVLFGFFLSLYIITFALKHFYLRRRLMKKSRRSHRSNAESNVIGRSHLGTSLSERCSASNIEIR